MASAGLKDLHSWAFLGDSGRIATASDGVFLYTPAGPNAQLDLFMRAHELFHCGKLQVQARYLYQFGILFDGFAAGPLLFCLIAFTVWARSSGHPSKMHA